MFLSVFFLALLVTKYIGAGCTFPLQTTATLSDRPTGITPWGYPDFLCRRGLSSLILQADFLRTGNLCKELHAARPPSGPSHTYQLRFRRCPSWRGSVRICIHLNEGSALQNYGLLTWAQLLGWYIRRLSKAFPRRFLEWGWKQRIWLRKAAFPAQETQQSHEGGAFHWWVDLQGAFCRANSYATRQDQVCPELCHACQRLGIGW